MEQEFYRDRLVRHGFDVRVPDQPSRAEVHRIIYDELVHGIVRPESREIYLDVVNTLAEQGAEAVILGCTEIELLIRNGDAHVPLLETARLHAQTAADVALGLVRLPTSENPDDQSELNTPPMRPTLPADTAGAEPQDRR